MVGTPSLSSGVLFPFHCWCPGGRDGWPLCATLGLHRGFTEERPCRYPIIW